MEKKYTRPLAMATCIAFLMCHVTTYPQSQKREVLAAADVRPALESITADDLLKHIRLLASDEYEGRAPGTRGEDLTVKYLIEQLKRQGLRPGNPDGTYTQKVSLFGYRIQPAGVFHAGCKELPLKFPEDFVMFSLRGLPEVKVGNADVVFAGYGVHAPEYGWDDYKDVSVRGKTVIVLESPNRDPAYANPAKFEEVMVRHRVRRYAGWEEDKIEAAARRGAAAIIFIQDPVIRPYQFFVRLFSREQFYTKPQHPGERIALQGLMRREAAEQVFAAAGQDFDALKERALGKDFKPIPLPLKSSFTVNMSLRWIESQNVIAKLEGSDPRLKDEYVIYTAHWDHLGKDGNLAGDQIYNGAADNATGTSALLEIAEAYTKLKRPPRRTILFMATTAEEAGLLGARYYVENPLYPLARTLANVNIDVLNFFSPTKDITNLSFGYTTLDELLEEAAAAQQRTVRPDFAPQLRLFQRSDHLIFAKVGVPVLYTSPGIEVVGSPPGYGLQKYSEFFMQDYHKVSDEVKPGWELSGGAGDARLLFHVGYFVAQGDRYPEWKAGTEYRLLRERVLKRAAQFTHK